MNSEATVELEEIAAPSHFENQNKPNVWVLILLSLVIIFAAVSLFNFFGGQTEKTPDSALPPPLVLPEDSNYGTLTPSRQAKAIPEDEPERKPLPTPRKPKAKAETVVKADEPKVETPSTETTAKPAAPPTGSLKQSELVRLNEQVGDYNRQATAQFQFGNYPAAVQWY